MACGCACGPLLGACGPSEPLPEPVDAFDSCTGPGGRWEGQGAWIRASPSTEGTVTQRYLDPNRLVQDVRRDAEGRVVLASAFTWRGDARVTEWFDDDGAPGFEQVVYRQLDGRGREVGLTRTVERDGRLQATYARRRWSVRDLLVEEARDDDGDGRFDTVDQWTHDDAGRVTSWVTYDGESSVILTWWRVEVEPGEDGVTSSLWRAQDRDHWGEERRVTRVDDGAGTVVWSLDHGDDGLPEVVHTATTTADGSARVDRFEIDGATRPPRPGLRFDPDRLFELDVHPGLADGLPEVVQEVVREEGVMERVGTDTDGDGVEDWVERRTMDELGFLRRAELRAGDRLVERIDLDVRCVR